MIAVMGAAGNVGSRVTERLLREGRAVQVLEHRRKLDGLGKQGAEVVTGDAVATPATWALRRGRGRPWCCCPRTWPIHGSWPTGPG